MSDINIIVNECKSLIKSLAGVLYREYSKSPEVARVYKKICVGLDEAPILVITEVGKQMYINRELIEGMENATDVKSYMLKNMDKKKIPKSDSFAQEEAYKIFDLIHKFLTEKANEAQCKKYSEDIIEVYYKYLEYLAATAKA